MESFPFLTSVLGIHLRSLIGVAKVKIPLTIAKFLGRREEPFLLTNTSFGLASEHDLAFWNRRSLSPVRSSRERERVVHWYTHPARPGCGSMVPVTLEVGKLLG
jgi:hypothetical protein